MVECFTGTLAVLGSFPNRKIRRREVKKRRTKRRKRRRKKNQLFTEETEFILLKLLKEKKQANWIKNSMIYLNSSVIL